MRTKFLVISHLFGTDYRPHLQESWPVSILTLDP